MSEVAGGNDVAAASAGESETSSPLDAGTMPPPDTLAAWALRADAIRATTKRLEKSRVLEEYLPLLDDRSLAVAARFYSGIVFPRHDQRTTSVGGSIVFGALVAITGADEDALHDRVVEIGDMGDLARELFADRAPSGATLLEAESWFAELAATGGSNAKRAYVRDLLARLGGTEAQYVVKLLLGSGELRIGLKEAQVEEAAARAFGQPLDLMRRANLLRGDVGDVVVLARAKALDRATLALFHPIGFMLAQPLATAEEIVAALPTPFAAEDKYDGIRAQAHVGIGDDGRPRVALFSRTLDEITHGYPEVVAALGGMSALPRGGPPAGEITPNRQSDVSDGTAADVPATDVAAAGVPAAGTDPVTDATVPTPAGLILDGELVAYDPADPLRARPFKDLQRRLGRKTLSAEMLAEVPVQLVIYDVLAADGALVIDESYADRRRRLEAIEWPSPVVRLAPLQLVSTPEDVERRFTEARAAGNEGLIAKDLASPYMPGRRGKSWIKLKKAMATLDVVVTGVERGHGRRAKVLSDYTFAVRASDTDPTLLNVGKAYNGLTDVEILELTARFEGMIVQRFGRFSQVRPEVVLEVTFDIVQESKRHKAGYALRFPRIVRIRDDKPVSEIDTLDRVRALAAGGDAA